MHPTHYRFRIGRGLVVLAVCLAALLALAPAAFAMGADKDEDSERAAPGLVRANILYLNSYHDGYSWSDEILDGLRRGLRGNPGVELQVEYMDLKRYPRAQTMPLLVDLYKQKFQDKRFDLVVVSDNIAFEFWQKYGQTLFPGLPMVFCGVNDMQRVDFAGQKNLTGVIENFDAESTLNVALYLHPGKTRLVIIGDSSVTGRAIMNQVLSVRDRFAGHLEFVPWTKFSLQELRAMVARAGRDTMFYFIPFYTALEGRFYSAQELLEIVHQSTDAPIYTNWEFLLGHGAMGGKMLSGRRHGRLAAEFALRILGGEKAEDIPIRDVADSQFEFDYKVLMQHGIKLKSLPPGSKLINEPKAFYELDKQVFWTIIVSFALLLMTTVLLVRNIIRRRAVERRIQDQLSFQEILMDTIPQLICWKDHKNRFLGANRYFLRFFGVTDPEGLDRLEGEVAENYQVYSEWANRLNKQVMLSEKAMPGIKRTIPNVHGEVRQLEIKKVPLQDKRGRVVGTLTTAEDVTRSVNLEKQLLQSQKMEAIGNLAGGIAHDFNNILTSIINSIELALMDVDTSSPTGKDLGRALKASQRGSALVKQILTFSRPSKEGVVPTRIQDVVREALGLLRASLPRAITVKDHVTRGLPLCMADPNQINQIVMNLCTNSFHALRDTGGTITIFLGEEFLDGEAAELRRVAPGRYAKLVVADDGPGIPQDIMDKIFDPFFTTKGKAEGTGLGLAVVLGIVRGHQGAIEVESRPGYTAFTVLIPEHAGEYEARSEVGSDLVQGSGHLLFVEDDEDQLEAVPRVLESLGYTVTPAPNAAAALSIVDSDPDGFDLVITDFDMPVMNGLELARALGKEMPGVPVVIVTGRERAVEHAGAMDNVSRIVLKPYDRTTIGMAIREVLTSDERSN
ncbi:hybrid sensor histidine kinase/response regulator [Desulfocurvus sp. DL9XJH121]